MTKNLLDDEVFIMEATLFLTLFTIFSTMTGICTECCKKILDDINIVYSTNILALIVASIVGSVGTCIYYIMYSIPFNLVNIIFIVLMAISNAFGAMVGYDKIIQTIEQLKTKN